MARQQGPGSHCTYSLIISIVAIEQSLHRGHHQEYKKKNKKIEEGGTELSYFETHLYMQTAAKVNADHAMDKGLGTEEGVSEEDMDILRKEYDEILESMKENGTTYAGLKSSASVICGFAGWMALAVDKEVKCPAFAICISLSAALSLSMVIIFTLLDITTARLSGYVKADFINDTCYYRAGGWLMLIYSLPLFLISFVLKFSCELDP